VIRARYAPESEPARIVVDIRTDHDTDSQLVWETLSGDAPAVPDRLDPVAIALVAKAMNFTQDLHLEGPVSWTLLANLAEYIDAWTLWRPDVFRSVAISADEVIDDRFDAAGRFADTAVTPFSGGVDGTFAVLANASNLLGRRSKRLAAAVLVHGFDIPLAEEDGFQLAADGATAMTDEIGVPLVTMRTNWKEVACPEWEMSFATGIAAVLHLFTDRAGSAAMAADNTYDRIVLPWGSNPISSPLLSSARMGMALVGAGRSRTEKCEAIGGLGSVRDHLRVCWAGDLQGRNCGRCEKCVRTKVNFLAAGHGVAPALGPLEPGELRNVAIYSMGAYAVYEELRDDVDRLPSDVAEDLLWLLDQPLRAYDQP